MGFRTLSHNMALWHIEYFKLKEFEKIEVERSVSFPLLFSCETVQKIPTWEVSCLYPKERNDLISKMEERHQEESEWIDLSPPSFRWFIFFALSYLSMTFQLFIKASIKPLRFNHFFGSSFTNESFHACHVKFTVNNLYVFFPVNLSLSILIFRLS